MFAAFIESRRNASMLYRLAFLLRTAERRARKSALRVHTWLARRRAAAQARGDLSSMSDRELKDIGITRVDVERVAWGASNRDAP